MFGSGLFGDEITNVFLNGVRRVVAGMAEVEIADLFVVKFNDVAAASRIAAIPLVIHNNSSHSGLS